MITLLIWVVLVIVACYVLAAVSILPLFYFVRLHHFRFGMPLREPSTALTAPLTDLELEDVITLRPEDWWEVPSDETLRQILHIGWMFPDGVHTRYELMVLEPNRRDYDESCPCGCGRGEVK